MLDQSEMMEKSEDNNDESLEKYKVNYMREKIIVFITKQKAIIDKILARNIFKIPYVFGSMISTICQREKVNVPKILTTLFS